MFGEIKMFKNVLDEESSNLQGGPKMVSHY